MAGIIFHNRPTLDIEGQAQGDPEPEHIPLIVKLHAAKPAQLVEAVAEGQVPG